MQALNLGLPKNSLLAEVKGKELLYHLRLVDKDNTTTVASLKTKPVIDNDDCEIYHNGRLIAVTSTQELTMLIKAATPKTFKLVEVKTQDETYYAAIEESVLSRQYAGILTNGDSRVVAFVQYINGTYWAIDGKRLFHLDLEIGKPSLELSAQDCLKYINKNPEQFEGRICDIILFN